MAQEKPTLGRAIDQILDALDPLDEGARKTALSAVCAHLNIALHGPASTTAIPPLTSPTPQALPVPAVPVIVNASPPVTDIRTLKEAKKPSSVQQMACVVAYYLKELSPADERKDSIGASELEKYFKQANFKLPKHLRQVLPDAKSAGYFDSASRGEYKLNAVGHNLVVHTLPASNADT